MPWQKRAFMPLASVPHRLDPRGNGKRRARKTVIGLLWIRSCLADPGIEVKRAGNAAAIRIPLKNYGCTRDAASAKGHASS
jgi:hypothetical protein